MTTKIPVELSSTPGIADSSNATAITIDSSENTTFSGDVEVGTTAPKINLKNTDTSIVADQSLGVIEVESSDGSTGSAGTIAKLDIAASGAFDGSGHGSDFRFTTGATNQSGSIALTEVMRVTSTGRVGIGKTDPNYHLVVGGTNPKIQIYDSAGSGQTNLYFGDSGSNLAGYIVYQHSDNAMRFGTDAAEAMRIETNGRLLLNKTSSQSTPARFDVTRDSGEHAINTFVNSTSNSTIVAFWNTNGIVGTINTSGSATSYNTSSDARLKNVTGEAKGLEIINNLKPVEFEWKSSGEKADGLISQEVEEVFPQAVSAPELEGEWYSIDYSKLVTPLIKGMQEQQKQIEDLKSRIETLEE